MRTTLIRLTMLASVGMARAYGGDLASEQQTTCEHLLHAYPTPAAVAVALDGRVLFTCPGDATIGGLRYEMRDSSELADWAIHTYDRVIIEGEGDDD